jgi:aspartate/methionine/tyrosine aminotransferase
MAAVQTPVIPAVAEMIRRYPGTISLGQGVVYYGPPPQAAERISQFLADGENHKYKPVQGIPLLVDALEEKLRDENGVRVGEGCSVVVTAGGNMGFFNAVLAVADPGDEVILQTPFYFNHEMAITMAGCRPVCVATDAHYQLRPDAIAEAITPRTRAVVTISPNNPSGAVYPESALRAVNALCKERGLYHIHDEAYEYFTYDGASHFSPGSIEGSERHTISLFSLSKSYGFASWRIGYMVVPEHLLVAVKKIQDTNLICPPVISQFAALGALEAGREYCHARLGGIAEARAFGLCELSKLGPRVSVPNAGGAFYFLIKVDTAAEPMALVERLIAEHSVAVMPGSAFGLDDGCYLRVSYGSLKKETAAEGLGRLVEGLRAVLGGS